MSESVMVDAEALREQVQQKYREVATNPAGTYHFHTGRFLAAHLGYDGAVLATLPDVAVESAKDLRKRYPAVFSVAQPRA